MCASPAGMCTAHMTLASDMVRVAGRVATMHPAPFARVHAATAVPHKPPNGALGNTARAGLKGFGVAASSIVDGGQRHVCVDVGEAGPVNRLTSARSAAVCTRSSCSLRSNRHARSRNCLLISVSDAMSSFAACKAASVLLDFCCNSLTLSRNPLFSTVTASMIRRSVDCAPSMQSNTKTRVSSSLFQQSLLL